MSRSRETSISYLYIDGNSFRHAIAEISQIYFEGHNLPIDWSQMRGSHRKAFYYDAIPVQRPDEEGNAYEERVSPKRIELATIERQPGYHVKTGDVQRRRTRGNEQKMVDVQLTVDMLQAASRGLFSHCSLFTGDLDFRPLIGALVEMGVDVTLYYPPGHTSNELLAAADDAIPITISSISSFLKLSEDLKKNIPSAYFDLKKTESPGNNALIEWDDSRYGKCFVAEEFMRLRLVTERSPYNPKTHRLIVEAKNQDHLRRFADDDHGLVVPKW